MLWDDASRAFVRADPGTTRLDDPCLRGLTIEPGEVIARINKARGKGGRLDLAGIGLRRVPAEVWQLEDLADLQLSNNELVGLPEDIANLTKLERLGLAGNRLRALPEGVGRLARLEGLWAHGNVLGALPESIGGCESLRVLMLAGNRLRALPDAIGNLEDLEELSVPGNALRALPETVGRCRSLRSLDAHGNQIGPTVPASIADLAALEDLAVQGNRIEALPDGLSAMRRLRRLNVAENDLAALPERLGDAAMLTTLWCYANPRLARLPESLAANLSLKAVWAEACGLDGDRLGAFARDAEGARKTPPATLGLDEDAARRAGLRPKPKPHILKTREEDLDAPGSSVGSLPLGGAPLACDVAHARVSSIGVVSSWLAGGSKERPRGYFKLQRWRGGSDADVDASASASSSSSSSSSSFSSRAPVLVVAFGSAPGVPNWGGLLRKLRDDVTRRGENNVRGAGQNAAAAVRAATEGFDVLYVSDTSRAWYGGDWCDPGRGGARSEMRWRAAIEEVARDYDRVLHLGDSMGASAALLFADVADASLAFCPQVDLLTASIRPGRSGAWMRRHRDATLDAIERAVVTRGCAIEIHSGTWEHDLAQAELVPAAMEARGVGRAGGAAAAAGSVKVVAHHVDNHRLALALEEANELLPIVRKALHEQLAEAAKAREGAGEGGGAEGGGAEGEGVDGITLKRFNPGVRL